MTEEGWLACTDPRRMLEFIQIRASDRKLRLFAVGCFKRLKSDFWTGPALTAIEFAERYADGSATRTELSHAVQEGLGISIARAARRSGLAFAWAAVEYYLWAKYSPTAQAHLLDEVFGNPFRPVTADPRWLTSTVISIAQSIDADHAFDRLPILADALEEAGCDNPDVLNHLRGDGLHVKGCWAVDLVLRRE